MFLLFKIKLFRDPDDEELTEIARKTLLQHTPKTISENDVSHLVQNMLAMYKEVFLKLKLFLINTIAWTA